jgi:hypothetical protein
VWYRIELNKDRSVKSCTEVESSLNDGRGVHYIEANSKTEAIQVLAKRYKEIRAKKDEYCADWRQSKYDAGLCGRNCGRQRKATSSLCQECTNSQTLRQKQLADGAPSKRLPPAKTDHQRAARLLAEQERNRQRTRSMASSGLLARHKILIQVQASFDSMKASDFRVWLGEKILDYEARIKKSEAARKDKWVSKPARRYRSKPAVAA